MDTERTDLTPLLQSTDRDDGPYLRALAHCALFGWNGCTRSERRRLSRRGDSALTRAEALRECLTQLERLAR